ncbi:methylenetetrahydrofolate reductase [Caminibacter pacificus]|uniref:Methylenetetrahydrofolate reductase n=1 Tax=Caminibacter pacificus TaxID=1424653 RepID=A0AAJ4RCF7_9BACT|nr:methylenetetrahydrofolate reductase [Caminibacter pacificus]QCI28037.1 methylenetetrahydrofolate reductase [Caminibacter pacificus]ROR39774.1 5,10-methylenetetrahydrofolate reductase [Caminibacter pacificus]
MLKEKLKDKIITLETTPPKSPTLNEMLKKLEDSKAYEYIDGFSTTDCPLSKLKYNSIIAAYRLQEKFKKPVIATMTMRDRNKIALQSDLLGANDLGITNILALTGDPAKMSDQPNVKGVVEGSSLLLLEIIRAFNNGMDYGGKEFKIKPKPITPFAVSNSYAKNFSTIERKIFKKVKNYAVGIITQPVYDIEIVDKMIGIRNKVRKEFEDERKEFEIIFGFFPITRLKTAQFLHSHVPGIYVPDKWIEKLIKAHKISEEEEYKVGLELSRNLFQKLLKIHPKIHIMTANRFEIVKELF